jgi:hypothetical protein
MKKLKYLNEVLPVSKFSLLLSMSNVPNVLLRTCVEILSYLKAQGMYIYMYVYVYTNMYIYVYMFTKVCTCEHLVSTLILIYKYLGIFIHIYILR